jgi:hypothetical protein
MADISMCDGHECPKKQECYRYTAPVNPYRQAYFTFTPYDKDHALCEMFTPNGEKKELKE